MVASEAVRVVIQTRPLLEIDGDNPRAINFIGAPAILSVGGNDEGEAPDLYDMFDAVHDGSEGTLDTIYDDFIAPIVSAAFEGINGTILAYGQTGAGKTHSTKALMKKIVADMWKRKLALDKEAPAKNDDKKEAGTICTIELLCLELYDRKWSDLMEPKDAKSDLKIHWYTQQDLNEEKKREKQKKKEELQRLQERNNYSDKPRRRPTGSSVPRASKRVERSSRVVKLTKVNNKGKKEYLRGKVLTQKKMFGKLVREAENKRTTAATKMNERSSRSHSVICIEIEIQRPGQASLVSKLQILDLAGSENAIKSGTFENRGIGGGAAKKSNLNETAHINSSLSALGAVVAALANRHSHVPYKSDPLTEFLKDSIGGNAKALILGCIAPTESNLTETRSTLAFCKNAKKVTNKVGTNFGGLKKLDESRLQQMLNKATLENKKLKERIKELEKLRGESGGKKGTSGKENDEENRAEDEVRKESLACDGEETEKLRGQVSKFKQQLKNGEMKSAADSGPPVSGAELEQLKDERNLLQQKIHDLDMTCEAWEQKVQRQSAKIVELKGEIERLQKKPRVLVRANAGAFTSHKPDPSVYTYFADDIGGFSPVKKEPEAAEQVGDKRRRAEGDEDEELAAELLERYPKNPRLQGMLSRIGEPEGTFGDELDEELFGSEAVRNKRSGRE